jgi:hypothetical protein
VPQSITVARGQVNSRWKLLAISAKRITCLVAPVLWVGGGTNYFVLTMLRVRESAFILVVGDAYRRRGQLKCDGTRAETRCRLSAKRTSQFKSARTSVQSITGSRGVRISGSNARYTMFRGSVKSTGYPLHTPVSSSLLLPCVTVCHHISTGLYIPRLVS